MLCAVLTELRAWFDAHLERRLPPILAIVRISTSCARCGGNRPTMSPRRKTKKAQHPRGAEYVAEALHFPGGLPVAKTRRVQHRRGMDGDRRQVAGKPASAIFAQPAGRGKAGKMGGLIRKQLANAGRFAAGGLKKIAR
jgi:hypothetical protein